ncbi:MAG: DUF2975 domain-containing protein [Oscillospiraceae bacterium]|nr:DUF2975 domain-containing protein [Oscillospiraceae bacterium]MBP3521060.1 DUF2975 domain-containing protein [Oscillospiraceae bacterium]
MEKTNVQKLAKILKILVTITFTCNLVILPLVPGIVGIGSEYGLWGAAEEFGVFGPEFGPLLLLAACWQYLFRVWRSEYTAVLAFFLMACGVCTAVILWQARKVLDTILVGNPFQKKNGESLKRAAVCCFVISAAALVRMIWRLVYFNSPVSLFSYNTLFVPLFAMGGLLCMVMSALFRQAAELKEENDLTI